MYSLQTIFGKLRISNLAYILLVLSPILSIYASPIQIISYGELGACISTLLLCITNKKDDFVNKASNIYLVFFLYACFISVLMTSVLNDVSVQDMLKESLAIGLYITLLILLSYKTDIDKVINIYISIARYCSYFLMFQFIVHSYTGYWIPGLLPNLISDAGYNTSVIIDSMTRACSFFKEPAHYCQFMTVPLLYLIFKDSKNQNDKFNLCLFVTSILMAFSGNGLIVLGIATFFYMIKLYTSNQIRQLIKGLFVTILLAGLLSYVLLSTELATPLIQRIYSGELMGDNLERVSGYVRIVRGYIVFNEFDFINKLLGVGFGNYETYALNNCFSALSSKTSYNYGYLNGIQYYLTSTGIIGLLLYLFPVIKCYLKGDLFIKCVIVAFIAICSMSAMTKGPVWILLILTITKYTSKYTNNYFNLK